MKNIFAVLLLFLLISSCREDLITETTVVDEPIPTNTYVYEFDVFGLVIDEDGEVLKDAIVSVNEMIEVSDKNGYFEFEEIDGTDDGVYISVEKDGYVNGGALVVPNGENAQQIKVVLIRDNSSTLVSNSSGGILSLQNGSEVIIPANAFESIGGVNVVAHFIPNSKENFHEVYPSSLVGKDTDGIVQYLNSIGAVVVEFTDENGNEIKLKSGVEVMLRLPVPQDAYTWPEEIKLWSLNESTGYWEEESTAKKAGNFYEGTVSHFSWWSASEPADLVDVCFSVKDERSDPIANVEMLILSWYTGYIESGFTDSDGVFCTKLGAGDENLLFIVNECFSTLYNEPYVASVDETEKEIIITELPLQANFEGSIRACDGSDVIDGYLSFNFGSDKKIVKVENGTYSFSSYCGFEDSSVEVLAVDKSDFSSSTFTVEIEKGKTEYIRDITLCETLETFMQYNNVTKGREVIFTNCSALQNPSETLIVAKDAPNNTQNVLLGVEGFMIGEFGTSLLGIQSETALPGTFKTTFTAYQNIGGIVEGTFEGVTDEGDTIEGKFKALRTK